ncbi:ComEC/Rec2 family competence protein [Solirubrobacter taibaiensis]|nr:ComEC/Rec2 family competence protein [Solirubrobacter taibaiensis]
MAGGAAADGGEATGGGPEGAGAAVGGGAAGVGAAAGGALSPAPFDGAGPAPAGVGVGDIVAVSGRVAPLGFADAYQRPRNAHAAIDARRVTATGQRRGGFAGWLDGVRRRAEAGLGERLEGPEAALLRGMVLGADERLSEKVKDDFQASGLAHILAVSGQNVMLLVVLVLAACALIGVPYTARIVLAVAVVALYVPLTGAGPSIQRAGVMGIAGLVAALAGRPGHRWYGLLLAAAVTLALNPRAPEEPGWQLSFVAVAALLAGAQPLRAAFARRLPGPVADVAAITIAATLGTAPLMALHFQQVSLAALPANLLAAPAIAPVMWLGVLASTAAQVSPALAAPFTALTGPLLVYIQQVAHHTAGLPLATIEVNATLPIILAAWAVLMGVVALALRQVAHRPRRRRRRRTTFAIALAAAVTVATVAQAQRGDAPPAPGVLRVTFLDVGQGDATLFQLDGISVLVDTGVPDGPILARLKQAGIDRLDALMLTHAESDHEGAAAQVIARHRPRLVVDGGAGWDSPTQRVLAAHPANLHAPAQGETITLGRLTFQVLWPPKRPPGWRASGDPNDNALVTRLEAEGISMLLTADAESHVLLPLRPEPVDILKVSHHGSADPGLPTLLQQIRPKLAAIEVGAENTYGHPAPSTLAALIRAKATVIRTDRDGTTVIHADDGRVTRE